MQQKDIKATLLAIRDRIREINQRIYEDPIPTSDIIFRKYLMDLVDTEDNALYYLRILTESNFIFTIHLVEPDPLLRIPGIYGYVVSELNILEPLLREFHKKLESIYESEKKKKVSADMIIRELMPQIRELNNTALGEVLNVCIMLEQFIRIIKEKPEAYSESFRLLKLKEFLPRESEAFDIDYDNEQDKDLNQTETPRRRAVDTEEYKELSRMNLTGNWKTAVEKFGVQFLIRVHLRKMEFDVLKKLLLRKHIAREEDLLFLRESLRKMEERSLFDKELKKHLPEIRELKRITQIKLNQFFLLRKKYGE